MRSVIHVAEGDEEIDPTTTGELWVEPLDGEPIDCDVVLYMLDLGRLRGALEAAAAGEPVDDILLALDAAALDGEGEG